MADPKTVADVFASRFSSVSRKDSAAPGTRYQQSLEAVGVQFASPGGESYYVTFSLSKLKTVLCQCRDFSRALTMSFMLSCASCLPMLLPPYRLHNLIWRTSDFPSS